MSYKICIHTGFHPKIKYISKAVYDGCIRLGFDAAVTCDEHYTPRGDLLIAYGWKNEKMFSSYNNYLYIDIGYWGRQCLSGEYDGYYKVILNARHPTKYFQRYRDMARGVPDIQPWHDGDREFVVIAGMSEKCAESLGFGYQEWELSVINRLRTERPIIYRPKPNRLSTGRCILGTIFSPRQETIEKVLEKAYVIIGYHSNVAIDSLINGVPIVVEDGPAKVMSGTLGGIDKLYMPDDREQFLADLSYCQWRRSEIEEGKMLDQFIKDGLIFV